jgi:nucleoside-diphosphate-sugar epimerase
MRVLLAGASGVLGTHITTAMAAAGHEVVGLSRTPGNDQRLRALGAQPLVADAMDRDVLLRAVDGVKVDAVIHALTALRKPPLRHRDMAATDALRITGTANLIEAAHTMGARRFVSESMVFGYGFGDWGSHVLTEQDTPFGPPGGSAQLERHIEGMRSKEEQTFAAEGIEGIALRFGPFYGPGGTEAVVQLLRKRRLPVPAGGGGLLPWVNVLDAATAAVAALERGRTGQAYNIVDDEAASLGDHVRFVAQTFGTPRPFAVPLWMLRPMTYLHATMSTSMQMSNAKAKEELGWTPAFPTYRDGLRALGGS